MANRLEATQQTISELRNALELSNKQLSDATQELCSAKDVAEMAEMEAQFLREHSSDLERQLRVAEENYFAQVQTLRDKDSLSTTQSTTDETESLKMQIERLAASCAALQSQVEQQQNELIAKETVLRTCLADSEKLRESATQLPLALRDLEELRRKLEDSEAQTQSARSELASSVEKLTLVDDERRKLRQESAELRSQLANALSYKTLQEETKQQLKEQSQLVEELKLELFEQSNECANMERVLESVRTELQVNLSERQSLESVIDQIGRTFGVADEDSVDTEEEIQKRLLKLIGEVTPTKSDASSEHCSPSSPNNAMQLSVCRQVRRQELRELREFRDLAEADIKYLENELDLLTQKLEAYQSHDASPDRVMELEKRIEALEEQLEAEISAADRERSASILESEAKISRIQQLTEQLRSTEHSRDEAVRKLERILATAEARENANGRLEAEKRLLEEETVRLQRAMRSVQREALVNTRRLSACMTPFALRTEHSKETPNTISTTKPMPVPPSPAPSLHSHHSDPTQSPRVQSHQNTSFSQHDDVLGPDQISPFSLSSKSNFSTRRRSGCTDGENSNINLLHAFKTAATPTPLGKDEEEEELMPHQRLEVKKLQARLFGDLAAETHQEERRRSAGGLVVRTSNVTNT
eukprot:c4635_g1_i1.p1 GENE.c4635_g1_i1~~c4635_g1_i1.p1  ORF type:complete len:728 (+),score=179.04 c4635_g1_i1:242-2185(+)